jgi:DNA-binding MarR family transcriptional regulator
MELKTVTLLLNKFRQLDGELPLSQMLIILEVAKAGESGTTLSLISKNLNLGNANTSRNLAQLGKINRKHEEGMGIIDAVEHPMDRRLKILTLSFKGKLFLKDLLRDGE